MHSHYGLGEARLLLVAATLVYVFAVSLAPALHFAEGAGAHAHVVHGAPAGDPLPLPESGDPLPFPDGQDELDCLFCQALSHQPHPSSVAERARATSAWYPPQVQGWAYPDGMLLALRDARAPPSA
jgi:hypothetical protein